MQEQNSEIVHQQQQVIKLTQNKQIDIPSDHKVEQIKLHEHEEGQHNEVQVENKKDQIQQNAADIKDHNQNTKISGVNKEASLKQEQPGQVQQLKQSIKADQDINIKNEDQIETSKQQKDQSKQETKQNADTATLIQRIDHNDDVENIQQPTPAPQVDNQEKAGEQKTTAQQNNIQTKLGEANQQGNEQVQEEKPVQNINKQKEDEKVQGDITVPKELQTKLKQNKDEVKRQDQCKQQYKDEIAEKDPYKKEDVYKGEDKKQKIEEVQLQLDRQQAVKSTEKKQLMQEQPQQQNKEKQGGQGGQAREDQLKLEQDKDKEEVSKQEKQSEEEQQEEQQQQVATQSKEAGEQEKGEQNKQQTLQYKKQEQIGEDKEEYEANNAKQSKQINKNVNEQNNQKQYQGIKQQQSMNKEYKEQEQNRKSKKPNLMPIVLTEQNEPYTSITLKQLQHKQIIQFEQYKPILSTRKSQHIDHDIDHDDNSKSKTVEVDSKIKQQQNQKNSKNNQIKKEYLATQYQGIQNQTLLKRIQQLEETVKQLKAHKQVEKEDNTASQTVEKQKQKQKEKDEKKEKKEKKKNKDQIIHDASVHGLVSQLAKTETENTGNLIKKPALHQKRYKRRKLDLSNLMDKNMTHASNLFNVTIGQILNPNSKHEQQKQALRKQIKTLRQKVLLLEQDKRALSTQRPGIDTRRQTASTGKKQICGKLVKISQLKASRVSGFEQNDSVFKTEINKEYQKIQTKSQRDSFVDGLTLKNKVSSNSATQRQKRQSDRQKDNPNNMSFRVRRPTAKSSNFPNQQDHSRQNLMNEQQQKIHIIPVSTQDISHKKKVEKTNWWQQPFITSISMPQMPSPPSQFDSQEDLYTLGKLTFMAFGVDVDGAKQMNVKKYKNCVYFNIGEKNNILWYFDGRFYFGDWQIHLTGEGEKSGQGFQLVPGKFVYQGLFKEGKRNGIGKIKILNKQKNVLYEGNWVDGNKCGEGKQIDEYGIKYWGEWKDNKRDGFGRLKLQDGDYYEGYFQKGIKTGEGTQYFKNGDKYQGNYLANKFHGKGKYIWKNGSIYEGQFNHGIRSGQGKWKSNQTTADFDSYQGQYEGDKKNGYGKYKWADGSQYEGFFKDDLKQGQGTIRYKNGKVAKLLWRNGQPMKKLFSQQQQKYRQNQKSKQKERTNEKQSKFNKTDSISSQQFSIGRDD